MQRFEPIDPRRVRLYTCGLTVYHYAHLGNLRAYLFTDTLRRALQWLGYDVLHVMNITDVGHLTSDADEGEDKIEKAAAGSGRSVWDITEYYTRDFQENLERLSVLPPSVWCKATDHIQEMVAFARELEAGSYTYELDDGLYFDASRVADYGALGALDLEGQRSGARVEMKAGKRNPYDFCLWRSSPPDSKRLMEWESPWGRGAPGWHLECSVMSLKYLGAPFDIHTGGVDHRQVHHCNEIAQNQGYLGSASGGANFWLHNEFLLTKSEKMAKSTGDFLRLQTLLDWGIHPLVYRYFNLQTHYRSQLEFSFEALVGCRAGLERMLRRIETLREAAADADGTSRLVAEARFARGSSFAWARNRLEHGLSAPAKDWIERFAAALCEDLATPQALAILSEILAKKELDATETLRLVATADLALGLDLLSTSASDLNLRPLSCPLGADEINGLLRERREARADRDFARADEIRAELEAAAIDVEDAPGGSSRWAWRPSR